MRTSTKMFIFAAGAAVGSLFTWFYTKKYYEQIADDEIESMKEWLARRIEGQDTPEEEIPAVKSASPSAKPDLKEYAAKMKELGYTDYSRTNTKQEEPEKEEVEEFVDDYIYIIKPELFGEEDGYEEVSLTYYADGVLCDEQDNPIEDVGSMVVPDFASYYGYYEEDSVYVRNEHLKTDYEILADSRRYSDLNYTPPHLVEDE